MARNDLPSVIFLRGKHTLRHAFGHSARQRAWSLAHDVTTVDCRRAWLKCWRFSRPARGDRHQGPDCWSISGPTSTSREHLKRAIADIGRHRRDPRAEIRPDRARAAPLHRRAVGGIGRCVARGGRTAGARFARPRQLPGAIEACERAPTNCRPRPQPTPTSNAYRCVRNDRSGRCQLELLARAVAAARRLHVDPRSAKLRRAGHLLSAPARRRKTGAARRRRTNRHWPSLSARLATWGEERLRPVDRALTLMPAFERALSFAWCSSRGARGIAPNGTAPRRPNASASPDEQDALPRWLHGFGAAAQARGDSAAALESFEEEVASGTSAMLGGEGERVTAVTGDRVVRLYFTNLA